MLIYCAILYRAYKNGFPVGDICSNTTYVSNTSFELSDTTHYFYHYSIYTTYMAEPHCSSHVHISSFLSYFVEVFWGLFGSIYKLLFLFVLILALLSTSVSSQPPISMPICPSFNLSSSLISGQVLSHGNIWGHPKSNACSSCQPHRLFDKHFDCNLRAFHQKSPWE